MPKTKTLIADDEPLARQTVRALLAADAEIEVVGEARNGAEAIAAIRTHRPDLLFLDIQMPRQNGFEVIEAAGNLAPVVVFVTAYNQYAVEAFRAEAFDYLLKPFDDDRFFKVLARVKTHFSLKEWSVVGRRLSGAFPPESQSSSLDRLVIRSGNRVVVIPVRQVDFIESADNYVIIHSGGATHLIRQTMQELIASLDPQKFLRVHRSAAVNLDRVRELRVESHGEALALLDTGATVKVSRYRRAELEQALSLLSLFNRRR